MPFSEAFYQRSSRRHPLAGLHGEGRTGEKLSSSGTGPLPQVDSGCRVAAFRLGEAVSLSQKLHMDLGQGRKERKKTQTFCNWWISAALP